MRKYLLIALNVIALLGISSMAFAAGATLDAAALGTTCLSAALGIGIGKYRGKCSSQLPRLHTSIVEKINVNKIFLSLCIEEIGHGYREIIATRLRVVKDDSA